MKREATLGFVLAVLASLAACAPEYVLGGSPEGGAPATPDSGVSNSSGTFAVPDGGASQGGTSRGGASQGGTGHVVSSGGVSSAGNPGTALGDAGGSTSTSTAGAPDGAAGAPGPLVCGTGIRGGGYVNPCLNAGQAGAGNEAGAAGAGTPAQCHAYDLIGAYWNRTSETAACIESVDDLSPTTGFGIERGLLADLNTWSTEQFVETEDGLRVGAVGSTLDEGHKLYVLDLTTGITSWVSVSEDYMLAGVLSSGQFVGAYWTGSEEQVDLIEPTTGAATRVGTLGDLQWWSNQFVLDRAANCVYALGAPAGSNAPSKLYSLALTDGMVSSQPFPWDGFIGGVTPDGQIVGADFDSTSGWYCATIDPVTAVVTKKGALVDIGGLSSLVYDSTQNIAYSVTLDSSSNGISYLFGLDLTTGVETKVQTSHEYTLAKQ
jgi:hypothetical protein